MSTKADIAEYTACAMDGFSGAQFDHAKHGLFTSAKHAAFVLGEHLAATGFPLPPMQVRPGRGDLMHANGLLFRLNWRHSVKYPTITRET